MHKNRQVDDWNEIEGTDVNPHTYDLLIFSKETKIIQWEKRKYFQQDSTGINGC